MTQHILTLTNYLWNPIEEVVGFLKHWKNAYQEHKAVMQTVKELNALSNRELNDIGIARGDIYSIARGDATMKRTVIEAENNSNLKGWV